MAKTADGFSDGWIQYVVEPDDPVWVCDECGTDPQEGDTYWAREDDVLCEACFQEWRED